MPILEFGRSGRVERYHVGEASDLIVRDLVRLRDPSLDTVQVSASREGTQRLYVEITGIPKGRDDVLQKVRATLERADYTFVSQN